MLFCHTLNPPSPTCLSFPHCIFRKNCTQPTIMLWEVFLNNLESEVSTIIIWNSISWEFCLFSLIFYSIIYLYHYELINIYTLDYKWLLFYLYSSCWVVKSCLTHCNTMDCSTTAYPVLQYLLEFAQIHVHWVGDAI